MSNQRSSTPVKQTAPDLVTAGSTIIDPETGREIMATEEALKELRFSEIQINSALEVMSLALKKIKEQKLYLLRGASSFREYVQKYVSLSYRHVNRYISIADTYGDSEKYSQIASLPMKFLQYASSEPELEEQLRKGELRDSDGNIYTIEELTAMSNREMSAELKRITQQNSELKKKARDTEQRAEENEKLIQHYESSAGRDLLEKIKTREEAMRAIEYARGAISQVIDELSKISIEDASVMRELAGVVSGGIAGFSTIQDDYLPLLNAVTKQGE